MIYQRGYLARPLDEALAHASRLSTLRVLYGAPEGLSGRQIAVRAGINHQSAANALAALERIGLVEKRAYDRSTLWRLDRRKYLFTEALQGLFEGEKHHAEEAAGRVRARLHGVAEYAFIVGAAAKGRLQPGQPLELLALCEPGRRRALNEALHALEKELSSEFGVPLKASVMSKREAPVRMEILDAWQLLPREGRPTLFSAER